MSSFNLTELSNQLKDAAGNTASMGVSFTKKSLKLDSEEDALEVIKAIQECPKLEFLNLKGNTLGPLAAKAIGKVLEKKGGPLKRALWTDMFTGRLKTEIPKALEYLGAGLCIAGTHLVELDLSDNALGPIGVEGLASFLASSSCYTLRELRLNNNGLGIYGGKMVSIALLKCYENSLKEGSPPLALKVFIVGRNRLENDGIKALASVFKRLTSLEEVEIPQNGIYYQGITALASALAFNPGLRILNLNDNTIGPKGAEALAKALPNFRNLEKLNLGDCLLKTKGCLLVAEALAIEGNHPALTELNLGFNDIRKGGIESIAKAVADKNNLSRLEVNGNFFGAEGREILLNALVQSQRIKALDSLIDDSSDEDEENEEVEEEYEECEEEEEEEDAEENQEEENHEEENHEENREENREKITIKKPDKRSISIPQFLSAPTGENLMLLEFNGVDDFVEYAESISNNTRNEVDPKFPDEFTRIVMKISQLCASCYVYVRIKAETITNELYEKLCSLAKSKDNVCIWSNALLVNLDLIKSENKKSRKIDWNLAGCFKALEMVSQRDYFLEEFRNTLKVFLNVRSKKKNLRFHDDPYQDSRDSLYAVLNQK